MPWWVHKSAEDQIPKRRPARRGDVGCFGLHPDVIEYLPDCGTVRYEGDDADLTTADCAQEREYIVDAGDQNGSQTERRALRLHWLEPAGRRVAKLR